VIAGQALQAIYEMLQLPVDNLKVARLVSDAARRVLALSVKVEPERLRAQRSKAVNS
jgi:hypothetical protein